jgi:hypothetical protein
MSYNPVSFMNSAMTFALTQAEQGYNNVNKAYNEVCKKASDVTQKVCNYIMENKEKMFVGALLAAFVYNNPFTAILIGLGLAKIYTTYQERIEQQAKAPVIV